MYSISSHATKPSRAKAYELICFMKEGVALHEDQIDSLLLYFAPASPAKPKTPLDWLAKACSDDFRDHSVKRFIYVKDRRGIATDGHRVHEATVDIPDGVYCPKTLAAVEEKNWFDSAARVAHWPDDLVPFNYADLRVGTWKNDRKKGQSLLYYQVPADVAVNGDYLKQAVSPGEPETVYFGRSNSLQILTGENPFGRWLVCGMRV